MNGNPSRTRLRIPRPVLLLLGSAWVLGLGMGLRSMWAYESGPGKPAAPPAQWTSGAHAARPQSRPTLLLMAHPRCPCTGATMDELERLVTTAPDAMEVRVYFYQPAGTPDAWPRTDLWRRAASLRGVEVVADEAGRMARKFGAKTSGQALLYGTDGRLLFSGGLSDSRGHSGKSVGGDAVLSLLSHPRAQPVTTPVYGCSLVTPERAPKERG